MRKMIKTVRGPGPAPRLAAALFALLAPAVALAQKAGEAYQPYAAGSQPAKVSAPLFVVLAYSAIWLVLLLFVASIWSRQRRVQREVARLQRRLGGEG